MLKFLYQTMPGRCILKLLTRPGLSRFVGRFMDSAISRPIIPRFIRKNNIDMNDYLDEEYGCFNDFSVAGSVRSFGPWIWMRQCFRHLATGSLAPIPLRTPW